MYMTLPPWNPPGPARPRPGVCSLMSLAFLSPYLTLASFTPGGLCFSFL